MSRIITISVDLDDKDAAEQLANGAATLTAAAGNEAELKTNTVAVTPPPPPATVAATPPPPPPTTVAVTPPPPPAPPSAIGDMSDQEVLDCGSAATVDLDEEGLPWDARIHASSKKKLVKGNTWKLLRGLDPEFVETVKAELKLMMDTSPVSAAEAFGESGLTPVEELGEMPMTFPEVMNLITARMADNTLTRNDLDVILSGLGIPTLPMLGSRPDLIPVVVAELEAI